MKTFTKIQLSKILRLHTLWLLNNGKGKRANLSSANLSSADLRSANLSSANLRSVDLRYADLSYANLSSADLRSANLSSANLSSVDLRYADLSYAITDKHYLQISCIGSRKGITTYCVEDDEILCGCWKGSFDDFVKRVHFVYDTGNQYRIEYDNAIKFFDKFRKGAKK